MNFQSIEIVSLLTSGKQTNNEDLKCLDGYVNIPF